MNSRLMLLFLFLFMSCSAYIFTGYDDSYSMLEKGDISYKACLPEERLFLDYDFDEDVGLNDETIQLESPYPDSDLEFGDEVVSSDVKVTSWNNCFMIKKGLLVAGAGLIGFLIKYWLYDKNLNKNR